MQTLQGIAGSPGIAIAEAFLLDVEGVRIPQHFIAEAQIEQETHRLNLAMEQAQHELKELAEHTSERAGAKIAEIFSAHAGMLSDEYFRQEFFDRIRVKKYSAEFAVSRTMRHWRSIFQQDAFLRSRVADLDDLERRLLRSLLGERREELASLDNEVILVAHDLGPSDTASVDTDKVKGFAIDGGGPTSHTAIIATALGIPAVVGLETVTTELSGGDMVIVDGSRGLVIVDPDDGTLESYRQRRSAVMETDHVLVVELRDLPAETPDGRRVSLMGNIESPREIDSIIEHGAEGIGLYRTEFLYLASESPPSEEDHFRAYMEAVDRLDGRPITIRTLDLGADKFAPGENLPVERNPFLGRRSIRYCLHRPELLRTQLRAALRASAHGQVRVMFPLVSSVQEIKSAKAILEQVRGELDEEGEEYNPNLKVGIMVEVPSAAICADALARHADFFSIGTNDLVQYTLAVDRGNEHVAHLYAPAHPAVLRLIKMTVEAARAQNIAVSLCGEMAGDPAYAILLLGLGLDELSLAPPMALPEIKKIIRTVRFQDAVSLGEELLELEDSAQAMERIADVNKALLPEMFA